MHFQGLLQFGAQLQILELATTLLNRVKDLKIYAFVKERPRTVFTADLIYPQLSLIKGIISSRENFYYMKGGC